jgi:uracil-DNA glycosylase
MLGLTSLDASVGERFELGDAIAIPLPHPSGVSRWMNAPQNQERVQSAVALIHAELRALGTA